MNERTNLDGSESYLSMCIKCFCYEVVWFTEERCIVCTSGTLVCMAAAGLCVYNVACVHHDVLYKRMIMFACTTTFSSRAVNCDVSVVIVQNP